MMNNPQQRGSALILCLLFIIVLGMLGTVAAHIHATAQISSVHAARASSLTYAQYSLIEIAQKVQQELVAQALDITDMTQIGAITLGGPSYAYSAQSSGGYTTVIGASGQQSFVQRYIIDTELTANGKSLISEKILDVSITPVFQFMIFFEGDMWMAPGPAMEVNGRIHVNGDLRLSPGVTLDLNTEYVRATGKIDYQARNNGTQVNIKVLGTSSLVEMEDDMDSNNPDWEQLAIDTWNGSIQNSVHGVTRAEAPTIKPIKATDPDTGGIGYFRAEADLVIEDTSATDGSLLPVLLPLGTITQTQFYDAREDATITVTDIDLGKLSGSLYWPSNGLLYAYRTVSSGSVPHAIRLVNGSSLKTALTVVSENPVYILGDFNTVSKKPAAVLCDALNFLSNAWDDSRGYYAPIASSTSYNVCGVTGAVNPTYEGQYTGGFENLPRYNEKWTRKTASISGSFARLFESEFGDNPWVQGNVYSPPIRDYSFDPDLLDPTQLPPYTPNVIQVELISETVTITP